MSDNKEGLGANNNPFTNHQLPLGIRLYLNAMRMTFRATGRLSPKLASLLALRLFMTPPSFPLPQTELKVREKARLKMLRIDGEEIAIRSWGEGPTVLLSHGWGGRGTQFYALIEALREAGYRAVAFDAPAHGDSTGKRTNMLSVTRTIAGIMEREEPIKAVVGHSFGCGTALLAMDRYQLPSDKVVLFSCFTDTLWISEQFAAAFSISAPVIEGMRREARRRYADHFDRPWDWLELSPVKTIKKVTGELLLIHDRHDTEVPYQHALKLKEIAPEIELLTTERLGHKKILKNRRCIDACISHIGSG
ncbi:MAG: alpha/beta hydrolase [Candidatus Thiodiazotropha sp.]